MHMKQSIITLFPTFLRPCRWQALRDYRRLPVAFLLLLTVVSGWAQQVWTNPGYRNEPHGFQFDVNKVEFRPDETVLHITVRNRPNAKFSFGKGTALKTEDGKSYHHQREEDTRRRDRPCA